MVFQDYELISTKRVNRDRRNTHSIFLKRLFLASGGYSSVYLGGFASYAWLLRYQMAREPIPMNKYLFAAPIFFIGFVGAIFTIGESKEFFHLLKHYPTYRKEFKAIKHDLYYS